VERGAFGWTFAPGDKIMQIENPSSAVWQRGAWGALGRDTLELSPWYRPLLFDGPKASEI